ncbi:uncharacterized protein LOC141677670 isoform X2 [Apium graveolens]|uniref:uncharacterized protein LOC141677670 isoform X2 n=1 Tax=Apium graveolens TaxID=4045 RepID=UPI003D7B3B51
MEFLQVKRLQQRLCQSSMLSLEALKYEPPPVSSSEARDKQPVTSNGRGQPSSGSSAQSSSCQSQGKLVFGSNANKSNGTQKLQLCFFLERPIHCKVATYCKNHSQSCKAGYN